MASDGELEIRWNKQAEMFFADWGNIHFAISRTQALALAASLLDAVRELPAPPEATR